MKAHKTFYALLITQTFSLLGSRMTSIGVGLWVFTQTGLTTPLLLTAFFNELPGMLAGSLAGVLVDRWDRRRVMILADSGQALGSLLLMASFLSGRFEIWQLYTVAFLQGVFATLQGPAERAAVTMLVDDSFRDRANGLKETSFPLAGVAAPVLAGLLYTSVGIVGIILIDLITFGVAVFALLFIQIPHPEASEPGLASLGSFWTEAWGALRYVAGRRALLAFMLFTAFITFMLNGPLSLDLPYLMLLTGSEKVAGSVMGVTSLGAFAGAALIAAWGGTRPRMRTILACLVCTGLMFLGFGLLRTPVPIAAVLFVLFMNLPISQTLYISILQAKTPPDLQGRIFGLNDQLGFIGSTLSFALTGYLVDQVINPAVGTPAWAWLQPFVGQDAGAGIGLVQVATGLIILAVTALTFASPHIRNLEALYPDHEAGPKLQVLPGDSDVQART